MKRTILSLFAAIGFIATAAQAQPEYVAIEMEIDVNKPAAEVWSKVGGYSYILENILYFNKAMI